MMQTAQQEMTGTAQMYMELWNLPSNLIGFVDLLYWRLFYSSFYAAIGAAV
jgi:ABC-2 type transport system permease protein